MRVLGPAAAPSVPTGGAAAFAGVARLANGCSGVLLYGGRQVLGAAHCAAAAGQVVVWNRAGPLSVPGWASSTADDGKVSAHITAVALAPGWRGQAGQHDLAVFTLDRPVTEVPGYRLAGWRAVRAAPFVWVAGWGAGGTPAAPEPAGQLRFGRNEYDAWLPPGAQDPPATALFDFDDGSFGRNTLGLAPGGVSSLGLGADEAMLAGQDSGGPSFIEHERPGVDTGSLATRLVDWLQRQATGSAALRTELLIAGIHAGVQSRGGSNPGGIALDTLVAPHAAWIAAIAGEGVLAPEAPEAGP